MGLTGCTALGMGGTEKSPTHSHPILQLGLGSYIHPMGQGDQRVPGHKLSPMVQPLGPTSPFLGAAKEMKDLPFSSSPCLQLLQRGVSSTALATQVAGRGGSEAETRHTSLHLAVKHIRTLALLASSWGLQHSGLCFHLYGVGKLRQGKQVPTG